MQFTFDGNNYTSLPSLLAAMGVSWENGKRVLFTGQLSSAFMRENRSLGMRCQAAERTFQQDRSQGDQIFLKWLCRTAGVPGLFWKGKNYGNLPKLAGILQANTDAELKKVISFMAKDGFLSEFILNCGGEQRQSDAAHYLENVIKRRDSLFQESNVPIILGHILSGSQTFSFDGKVFKSEQELGNSLQTVATNSPQELLERKVEKLFQNQNNLDPKFEAWLIVLGKEHELNLWRDKCQKGTPDNTPDPNILSGTPQMQGQDSQSFAVEADTFEHNFETMLQQYSELVNEPKRFTSLMKDFFPENNTPCFLITMLYNMDIVLAINGASSLDEHFISRFVQRLVDDFGAKQDFARWAASVWCVYYGEKVMHKMNHIAIYKVS